MQLITQAEINAVISKTKNYLSHITLEIMTRYEYNSLPVKNLYVKAAKIKALLTSLESPVVKTNKEKTYIIQQLENLL